MTYSIIKIGNKQHRVRDGETLVVDRVPTEQGGTFTPEVLLGTTAVTVKVVAHERGPKIRIGKYRRRTGYKRHNGFRAATSRLQVTLGAPKAATPKKAEPKPAARPAPVEGAHVKGMPSGYEELTVAAIAEAAKSWRRPQLEAALEYEQANAQRKGAIAALEAALAAKEEK